MIELPADGSFIIGRRLVGGGETFSARAAADGALLPGAFSITPLDAVATACAVADEAFDAFRETAPTRRAEFLDAIAARLEFHAEALIERAALEAGLPMPRLKSELGRTAGQLRMFADVLREGHCIEAILEAARPDRTPLPRPDMRLRQIAVGPVAVFGASNFPLAFSTAGGDTASALAAGCPVVVKAHPAHPGAALLAGRAILEAASMMDMPEGVFSLVQGPSNAIGAALVSDPRIKAVGFTGSRAGGLALVDIAARRPEPIPVFAEMSSVNPVVLLPAALESQAEALAQGYVGSLTLGAGQFCTNPGLVFGIEGPDLDRFTRAASMALNAVGPQTMLHAGIASHFRKAQKAVETIDGVCVAARGPPGGAAEGQAALLTASASQFIQSPAMAQEVFGPSSLIVTCTDAEQLIGCLRALEGQLTVTLHMMDADLPTARRLLPLLERKAGRILVNGWPTGVEVSRAMVHGGPFPATSDPRSTSVGAKAIERFLRPICYQAFPDALLPQALQDANPLGLPRLLFD